MQAIPEFGPWKEKDHLGTKQENAIKAAQGPKITPMQGTVDREKQTAVFWGSGREPYRTSLGACTCSAFRGIAPCKHIYRLAMELGIIDLPFRTGTPKGELLETQVHWRDALAEIEKLPDAARQDVIHAILWDQVSVECGSEAGAAALRACPLLEELDGVFFFISNFTQARGTVRMYYNLGYTDPDRFKEELLVRNRRNSR